MKLRHIRPYSLRELAKRSTELAERRRRSELEFTQPGYLKWFRGISTRPRWGENFSQLSMIFLKTILIYIAGIQPLQEEADTVPIIVNVTDTLGMRHEYNIGIRPDVDLSRSHILETGLHCLVNGQAA